MLQNLCQICTCGGFVQVYSLLCLQSTQEDPDVPIMAATKYSMMRSLEIDTCNMGEIFTHMELHTTLYKKKTILKRLSLRAEESSQYTTPRLGLGL